MKQVKQWGTISIVLFLFIVVTDHLQAQEKQAVSKVNTEPKKFDELINAKAVVDSGLINIYRQDEKYYIEINDSLLSRDILSVTRISRGSANTRGSMLGYAGDKVNDNVLRWEKGPTNKLFLRKISFAEYSKDSTQQMYTAVTHSNLQPIVAAFDIKAYSKQGVGYIIDVTDYLNGDNDVFFFDPKVKSDLHLGSIQPDRSYIEIIRSYPINTEIKTVKTYTKSAGKSSAVPGLAAPETDDGGIATLELNTSLVLLPLLPMQPRHADPRVGYFSVGYTDFDINPQGVEKLAFIKRWRLEPKDPAAYAQGELVEPVKPIVFYIDPATPKKWVPYLIQGVNDWNKAFEQAGFKHAIVAKEAPVNDPDWSLEDATHNAIVYKASTVPNASGPSICDPRSGEILESHINWYHDVMELIHDWYMIQAGPSDPAARKMQFDDTLMGQLIRFVSSHEVGHTLGLLHNFGASSTVPVDSLRNKAWVEVHGHTPSIMDYARFNYVAQPEDHISEKGLFPRIGDYDLWAIEYGYRCFSKYTSAEEERTFLNQWVIQHQVNKRLWFGSEKLIDVDPRDQNEDLGDDAMKASTYGIKNLQYVLARLEDWTREPNKGYENLHSLYDQLTTQFATYISHVTRNVAGVYVTPKTVEQPGGQIELEPKNKQQRAVQFLNHELFTTPVWLLNSDIMDKIGVSDPTQIISYLQNKSLDNLLARATFDKLLIAEAKGGTSTYTASDLLHDLKKGIWSELETHHAIDMYRRNLQKQYISQLIKLAGLSKEGGASKVDLVTILIYDGNLYNSDATSLAKIQLRQLQTEIKNAIALTKDTSTLYHLQDIQDRIKDAFKTTQ